MRALHFLLFICGLVTVNAIHHVPFHSNDTWHLTAIPSTSWPATFASVRANPSCEYYFTTTSGQVVDGTFLRCYVPYQLHHRDCQGALDLAPRGTVSQIWVNVELLLLLGTLMLGFLSCGFAIGL